MFAVRFAANKISGTDQRKLILLTIIGPMAYKLLKSLVAPEKLDDKSHDALVEAMMKRHNLKCYRFNSWLRQHRESISTFVLELCTLAEFCWMLFCRINWFVA